MNRFKSFFFLVFFLTAFNAFAQETVAILPFAFTNDGRLDQQKGKEAQQFLIQYIQKKQKHFKVVPMNARDVNVALNKAGITLQTMDNFTTKEIADVLGADYILIGTIDRNMEGATTTNTGFGSVNQNNPTNANVYGGSVNSTTKKYAATVYISIFKGNGTSIYDKSKGNVFIDDTPDSWKNSIIWQVRHFPFYE